MYRVVKTQELSWEIYMVVDTRFNDLRGIAVFDTRTSDNARQEAYATADFLNGRSVELVNEG